MPPGIRRARTGRASRQSAFERSWVCSYSFSLQGREEFSGAAVPAPLHVTDLSAPRGAPEKLDVFFRQYEKRWDDLVQQVPLRIALLAKSEELRGDVAAGE